MRTFILLLAIAASACKGGGSANPADCTDKRDVKACTKLCESGGKDNKHFCYAERAFKMADCVDKNQGCDEACKEWTSRQDSAKLGDTEPVDLLKATIGGKYDQMASKCGSAPAPTPPAGEAPGAGSAPPPAGSGAP